MILEIFNLIKNYAESHKMISSFDYGDSFNIEKTGENIYPQIYLEYPFTITYSKGYKDITITFYIIDIPRVDSHDEIESINLLDKLENINDVLLMKLDLNDWKEFTSLLSSNSLTLTEWMGDKTVAIRTEMTLRVLRNSNSCLEPIN